MMVAIEFHTYHTPATSRHQFEGYAACAREEVESRNAIEVDIAVENIEKVLLGKISRWPCLETAWDVEMTSLVLSCYYTHITCPL